MREGSDLSRFTEAQERTFDTALEEIRQGRKRSHWMWFIFPQLSGLGSSPTAAYYALSGTGEAEAFLADPYLGENLKRICGALLELETDDPQEVFCCPDDLKLRSCLTLFSLVSPSPSLFDRLLEKFYDGQKDERTLSLLAEREKGFNGETGCAILGNK